MGNKSDDDFTFCQVGSTDYSSSDAQKVVQHISTVTLKDEASRSFADDDSAKDKSLWKDNIPTDGNRKEGKLGSLSFTVTSASPVTRSEGAGSSIKAPAEQEFRTKKPAARAKVPFEKGYSQMDWLKLSRTHPDLAGLKGQSNRRLISLNEVKQHRTGDSMWTVLKGRVYNIYPYMKFHPGGAEILMKAVGKDCTSLFNKYHAWVNHEVLLEKCLVGILDESSSKK